ncbi:N-acetyl sugar amidotransferase family protein [Synechococcus sp. NOUM97013]|nr:N-acetyl sugar amidotransferase family protein [Synechococcus sp. NOUM97013]
MYLFPSPKPVDKAPFLASDPNLALYGLPLDVKFCNSCVISNQRPSSTVEFKNDGTTAKSAIHFDSFGICDACRVKDQKNEINWDEREQELRDLCDRHRRNDGRYDCLVPGSGGKDSFIQAHLLKYKYGMHPLTCTWAPHIYTDWGWKNHQAWIHAGFDNLLFTPNGRVHRLITRLAVENLFHPFQPFILGQKNLAPKIAAQYDIPLIFYGENEAEYGNPKGDIGSAKRSWNYFSAANEDDIFLGGSSLSQLRELGLEPIDWDPYMPTNPNIIDEKKIEVHYLGYYEKWHPQGAYYYAVEHGGFQSSSERTAGTYSTYNSIDDRIDDFHYHTTWIKFGIGRATYDAAQEIRSGDITREEGVALVRKYDGEFPERWADEIFKYLSLPDNHFPKASMAFESPIFDRNYYDLLSDNFRSPHLWRYSEDYGWQLRHRVFDNETMSQELSASMWQGNN